MSDAWVLLVALLRELFDDDGLRRWVRALPDADGLVDGLPGAGASPASLFGEAAEQLLQRKLIDERLFLSLAEARPAKVGRVREVAASFGVSFRDLLAPVQTETVEAEARRLLLEADALLTRLGPHGAAIRELLTRLLKGPALAGAEEAGAHRPMDCVDTLVDRIAALSEREDARQASVDRELVARATSFHGLHRLLPQVDSRDWVGGLHAHGGLSGPVTPFVCYASATPEQPLTVRLRPSPEQRLGYRLPAALKGLLPEVERMRPEGWTNDEKLRIVRWEVTRRHVVALTGPSYYEDYLCTHWAFANLPVARTRRVRDVLFAGGAPGRAGRGAPAGQPDRRERADHHG